MVQSIWYLESSLKPLEASIRVACERLVVFGSVVGWVVEDAVGFCVWVLVLFICCVC